MQKDELDEASKLLDIGLGFNFRIREHPLYFLTKGRLEKQARRIDASIDLLRSALDTFGKSSNIWHFMLFFWDITEQMELGLAEAERIEITLELIDSLQTTNRMV